MIWPFKKKKKEEDKQEEQKKASQESEEKTIEKVDEEKLKEITESLNIDPNVLSTALERIKEMSEKKICLICGQPIQENDKYEEFDFMGTKLYMHEKCKKKFQKQILKLMRSGQLNKVMEMYSKMLKQGLPQGNYTFQAEMKNPVNDTNTQN